MSNPEDIEAEVIPAAEGLCITFKVTGDLESQVRQMFNVVNDNGDVAVAMRHVLQMAADSVSLVEKHKTKVY